MAKKDVTPGDASARATPIEQAYLPDVQPVEPRAGEHLHPFPTVAVGASAGGVEALQRFFTASPPDMGCAFVVVMHLAPGHESHLASLLERTTKLPVSQVDEDMAVQVNRVYVIAPGKTLEMHGGRLRVAAAPKLHSRPLAVDRFMTSLAADQRERAIGVVLTGVDGDGAVGVKAIKSEGGLTIAQLPSSAAHAGMPNSAVATGAIDRQLTIEEIPAAIAQYVRNAGLDDPAHASRAPGPVDLSAVLDMLRQQTGLDFVGYKEPMLQRRVRRRMGLSHSPNVAAYIDSLRSTKAECHALAADFLIGVTEFFREPDAWQALANDVLPALLEAKQPGDAVRAWVPGCATGEEAYSLAMLLLENPLVDGRRLKLQIFATDVDDAALETARQGLYPKTIESAVNRERLHRFFAAVEDGYRVRKELRDVITFAPQNLVHDPPFSRMDLISCRNLLIYLRPELQRRALQLFHFALVPGGVLTLGKSETTGSLAGSFGALSQGARLFRRIGATTAAAVQQLRRPGGPPPGAEPPGARASQRFTDYAQAVKEALLEYRPTTAVLTNREGQTLYFYGPLRRYIDLPEGAPTTDLFAMIDPALRPQLRAAIHLATAEHRQVAITAGVPSDSGEQPVRMVVSQVAHPIAENLLLVTFEDLEPRAEHDEPLIDGDAHALHSLEEELRTTKRELRAAIEELEAANEELKVANEEAMSTNEELQSSNEELETSQEELQSVNEELSTVNNQLQAKVEELEQVNDDLNNLLASTSIPTLFLDRQLHIKRFTQSATRLFSLIQGDVNRPLTDITSADDIAAVVDDARAVLDRLTPIERETRTGDGRDYLRRTLPYRTQEHRIDGVVITFIDVTDLKAAAAELRRYAAVMQGSTDAVLVHDPAGRLLAWNRGAEAMYGYGTEQALQMNVKELLPADEHKAYDAQVGRALAGERVPGWELRRLRRDGSEVEVAASISLIRNERGQPQAVSLIERDVTPQRRAQAQLRESERRFRALADNAPVLIWMSGTNGVLQFANQEFARFVGQPVERLTRRSLLDWLHRDDRRTLGAALAEMSASSNRFEGRLRLVHADGSYRWTTCAAMLQVDTLANHGGIVGSMVDIDAQVRAEEGMREASRHKDEFLAMLGHELRNPLAPIRNAAEVLHRIGGDDHRLRWVHDVLVRQVSHVTHLVDDLLDISMITRGSMQLRLEPVDLTALLRRARNTVAPLFERKRHRFDVKLPAGPVWVEGDQIRLHQVFENLLTNAAKYTDDGGAVALTVDVGEQQIDVHVRDNGLGLAADMRTRVFDLFVQDQRAIDRSQGGLGIGLALVKHLVTMHGGTVVAHSEGVGLGCDFEVVLPRLPGVPVAPAQAADQADHDAGGRVMVVDDDREGVESLRMMLQMFGYEVRAATDLDSAMMTAAEFRPQVVLLDIALPGTDGYEVARRLRAMPGLGDGLKIVGMSGFGGPADFERSRDYGFEHYFVKPLDPKELDRLLKQLIGPARA